MKIPWALAILLTLSACGESTFSGEPVGGPEQATFSGIYEHAITLTDGQYQGEPFVQGGASRPSVMLLDSPRWQLDLNRDGLEETLVLLVESSGGSGSFVYLAAIPDPAALLNAAQPLTFDTHLLGDRVEVLLLALGADQLLKVVTRSSVGGVGAATTRLRQFEIAGSGIRPLQEISGWLRFAHEIRELTLCERDKAALWVSENQRGVLRSELGDPAGDPYAPVFVKVLGAVETAPAAEFAADFSHQVRVVALQRREREGPGCELDLAGASFRAFGEEPFWSLAVYADRLEFSTMGAGKTVFTAADDASRPVWQMRNDVLTGQFAGISDAGQELLLELEAQACTDTMVGNRYAWRARLTAGAISYRGCALSP